MLLAVHRSQTTVVSWDTFLLIIFRFRMTPFFPKHGASLFWKNLASYDHEYCIDCSIFEECLQEADYLLLWLKNFHRLAHNHSTSSITSSRFHTVIFFVHIDIQPFTSVAFPSISKAVPHSLLYYFDNRFLRTILFLSSFLFPLLYVLFQPLSHWDPFTSTAACFIFVVLFDTTAFKAESTSHDLLWGAFQSGLRQRQFPPQNKSWKEWKSRFRVGILH